jgi:hypothetical protein
MLAVAMFMMGCRTCTLPAPDTPIAKNNDSAGFDLVQAFTGSSFTLEAGTDEDLSKTIHHFVATGGPGMAHIDMVLVFETHAPSIPGQTPGCDSRFPYGAKVKRMEWVQTYTNGAAFSGAFATMPPTSELDERAPVAPALVCTDGVNFHLKVTGVIVGGTGDAFRDVTGGRWEADAVIAKEITTGTINVSFEYARVKR